MWNLKQVWMYGMSVIQYVQYIEMHGCKSIVPYCPAEVVVFHCCLHTVESGWDDKNYFQGKRANSSSHTDNIY